GVGQVYVGFNKVDMGADGSFASTVTLADGLNTITVTAYDSAGNKSTLTIKVTFNRPDITPPVLSITSPANGTTTTSSQVTLRGTVTDAGSGLDYLEVNGTRVAVSSGSFTTTITLTPGSNTVTVSAWDKAGNKTEKTLTLTYQQGTVLVLTIGSTIATKNGGTVYLDTAPVITNGRTLVPLRFIAEAFGIDPIWNSSLKTIKLALSGGRLLTMQIGKGTCFVEWVGTTRTDAISLDAPPVIMNGRTLVPIRFISEQLGAVVVWDSITRRVTITWKG
ncbi:MAG: stalk domain-containing protein, partial [Caldiserica bacterium]|nr:stalk domain-containing protein [Caldisericota bacterium]